MGLGPWGEDRNRGLNLVAYEHGLQDSEHGSHPALTSSMSDALRFLKVSVIMVPAVDCTNIHKPLNREVKLDLVCSVIGRVAQRPQPASAGC